MSLSPGLLLSFALVIFSIYLIIIIFSYINRLDFIKKNFNDLGGLGEFSIFVFIFYIILYPYFFIFFAKHAFTKNKKPDDYYKPSRMGIIGIHIPLLLCWFAFWLYILNFILKYFSNM